MADAMQKDEVCRDCYYEERSYTVAPCNECSRAFSGLQKDWYSVRDMIEEFVWVNPLSEVDDRGVPIMPSYPIVEEACKDTDGGQLQMKQPVPDSRIEDDDYLTKLINDHWAYIEGLLEAHDIDSDIIRASEFHYKSAFKHGFKHAFEYMRGCE